jgi:hypothetical protein
MNKPIIQSAFVAVALLFFTTAHAAGTAINESGEAPHSSAMLDVQSVTKGLLHTRMTEAQRTAIVSPAPGLMVYQTDGTAGLYYFDGAVWKDVAIAN